ncbi:hypothetical protein VNO78_16118 [Psophocarpus tetragonolobus]|uniref:Uncharacterized protein n=1 Tax=Psophocarpus tetragonolobus TaxID=3891 RepID=A0AAN9SGK9_PSOTE
MNSSCATHFTIEEIVNISTLMGDAGVSSKIELSHSKPKAYEEHTWRSSWPLQLMRRKAKKRWNLNFSAIQKKRKKQLGEFNKYFGLMRSFDMDLGDIFSREINLFANAVEMTIMGAKSPDEELQSNYKVLKVTQRELSLGKNPRNLQTKHKSHWARHVASENAGELIGRSKVATSSRTRHKCMLPRKYMPPNEKLSHHGRKGLKVLLGETYRLAKLILGLLIFKFS